MIKETEKDVKDLKKDVEDAQGDRDDWQDEVGELEGLLSDINTKIEDLLRKLKDCVDRCVQGPVNIVKDYGMGQPPERGWFERFMDSIFGGEAGPPQDIPSGGLPLPLPPLPLQPFPPSFFDPPMVLPADPDAGPGITFPPFPLLIPECDECDGLLQLIKEVEEELGEMAKDLDELRHDIGDAQLEAHRAGQERDQAQRDLDRFNNPPSSASSGDTYRDSSDLEVERQYNRELWQQYRDGDLTAQELEQKWEEGLSDEDRERLKKERKEDLEEDLEDAQEDLDEANEDMEALERILNDAKKATDDLLAELQKLEAEYEKCLKKCMEKKVITIGGGILDMPPIPLPLPLDDANNTPQTGRITFGDGVIIRPGEPMDLDELLRQSDQFDPQTGQLDLGDQKLEYDENGNLIISNIGSSGEDGVVLDPEPPLDDTGFFCGTLGLFCPKEEPFVPTFDALTDCVVERSQDANCLPFDTNGDGEVGAVDIELVALSLQSVEPIDVGLDIRGMDGNDELSVGDIELFNDCLQGGPCDGLGADVNIGGGLDSLRGSDDFGLLLGGQGGNDILLGDPLDDLIDVGGRDDVGAPDAPPIPAGFFGPGSEPFDGIDLLYFGTTDRTVGLDWPDDDPPPPPQVPDPSQASPQEVPQAVRDIIARIIRDNPLGPCERLIINVRRVQIGTKVTYTVSVTRTRDPLACPQERCPAQTSFESIGSVSDSGCSAACQNGAGGCAVLQVLPDGTNCILCGPPTDEEFPRCQKDGGFSSMEDCQASCSNPETCGYDGGACWMCDDTSDDVCEDIDCDDGDECTEDECNPETGECINTPIEGCGEDEPVECPDIAHTGMSACQNVCSNGTCEEMRGFAGCYICKPRDLAECPNGQTSSRQDCQRSCDGGTCTEESGCWNCMRTEQPSETCPSGTDIESSTPACSKCSSGECENLKTLPNGTYCLKCLEPTVVPQQCDSPTKTESKCNSSCDGTCVKSYTRDDGVKCYECLAEEGPTCPSDSVASCSDCSSGFECFSEDGCSFCRAVVDDGPTCPSGTVSDKSSCESQCAGQGGVCLDENEDGCFECTVINCPSGTFKDECPSSCTNGCDTAAEQHGVSCFTCKQSCEEFCGSVGLDVAQDYSSYILGQLNGHSCVSGAGISVQSASRGDCNCLSVPEISVDTTVPICAGTSCGDVACGQSATCSGGENTTITVTCNWGGWEQVDEFQFRPVLGQ
jgi:hypothetical protein